MRIGYIDSREFGHRVHNMFTKCSTDITHIGTQYLLNFELHPATHFHVRRGIPLIGHIVYIPFCHLHW